MTRRDFIPLAIPNMDQEELSYVIKAVQDEQVSVNGPFVAEFEDKLAAYLNVDRTVAVNSGTAGLHLALMSIGVNPGDEVIVPTITFISPVNAIRYVGAEPVFMDCDEWLCMDTDKFEEFCTKECMYNGKDLVNKGSGRRISAVLPVHILGNMVNMERVMDIANKYGIKVIEDASEALGCYYISGRYKGMYSGTIGDVGVYSFNANKIITTGSGGGIAAHDNAVINRVKYLSTQAKDDPKKFIHNSVGYNYRMGNLSAGLGLAQIGKLERFIKLKGKNYIKYIEGGITLLPYQKHIRSNQWFYSYVAIDKDALITDMDRERIQCRSLWMPIHLQEPYKGNQAYCIERAVSMWNRVVNLPCSTGITEEDIRSVIDVIHTYEGI